MRFIDVKIRVPKNRLGDLLENLPAWGCQMVGYDLLQDAAPVSNGHDQPKKKWKPKHNPNFRPAQGTAADMVLKILGRGTPLLRKEILAAYKGEKYAQAALQSGIYALRDHGVIRQNDEGKYEVARGE